MPHKTLLRKCYHALANIQQDGWATEHRRDIQALMREIKELVFQPVPYTESIVIFFRCVGCDANISVSPQLETEMLAYLACEECGKKFQVVWKHSNVNTFVLAVDEHLIEESS